MKKSFLVLLLAVLLPSLLLGWLALRSTQEQGIILERRTAELCQRETDNVATTARSLVNEQRREFVEIVRGLLTQENAHALAGHFTANLRSRWPQPALGFALDDTGRFLSPTAREASTDPTTRQFLRENSDFLGNKATAPAYAVAPAELNRPEIFQRKRDASNAQSNLSPNNYDAKNAKLLPNQQRNVVPQQQNASTESQVYGANAEFREFTAGENEGVVNRFVNDRLNMIFWVRPATARDLVFGCLLHAEDLRVLWDGLFVEAGSRSFGSSRDDPAYILALLDDKGQPVAISPAGSPKQGWRKPFAATEIGEALPHWRRRSTCVRHRN